VGDPDRNRARLITATGPQHQPDEASALIKPLQTRAPGVHCEHRPDGRITAQGVIEVYDLPTPGAEPHGIASGPDGALWTALEIGALARISPTTVPSTPGVDPCP
jgi:hypothetical protein